MLNYFSNKKGEIATALTIGTLVVLAGITLITSFIFRDKKIKTKPRAEGVQIYEQQEDRLFRFFFINNNNIVCFDRNNDKKIWDAWQVGGNQWNFLFKVGPIKGMRGLARSPVLDDACAEAYFGKKTPSQESKPQQPQKTSQSPMGSGGEVSNGCFSLSAEFEVRDEDNKKAFYSWVRFKSSKGGDIKLDYNGIHVAGWNGFAGGIFTYEPKWTQPYTHDYDVPVARLNKSQSLFISYRGMHSGCSPQDITINCTIGYSNDGSVYVSGEGCNCKNCQTVQQPPPTQPPNQTPNQSPTSSSTQPKNYPTLPPTPIPQNECQKQGGFCVPNSTKCRNVTSYYSETRDKNLNNSCGKDYKCCVPISTSTPTQKPQITPETTPPTSTPTPKPQTTPETAPPIPTPTPMCDVTNSQYCIEWTQTNKKPREENFPWCQLPDGRWVKLVETGTYTEICSYPEIPGLKGNRKVERSNGGEDYGYGCKYIINNTTCNHPEGDWDPECNEHCEFPPESHITIKIGANFFREAFPANNYDLNNTNLQIKVRVSETEIVETVGFNPDFKEEGYELNFSVPTENIINYFYSPNKYQNPFIYLHLTATRTASGITNIVEFPYTTTLNPDDLSIVIDS